MADHVTQLPVTPASRFRIASLSKPLTAVAVLKLVDDGKLSLDDKMVDLLGLVHKEDYRDPRISLITVRQLLQHYAGWDRERTGDPMFQARKIADELGVDSPPSKMQIRQSVLQRRLDNHPGGKYAYSNFGYLILGQIIEEVSGQTYVEYVQANLLKPLGLNSFQLGRTLPAERLRNEVSYYARGKKWDSVFASNPEAKVRPPYGGFCLEAMDAHGGWVATASDLALFASAVDLLGDNLLSPESVQTMVARYPVDGQSTTEPVYYGCGWLVRELNNSTGKNIWHGGALPGSSSLMVARHDGFTWAVLFNGRYSPKRESLVNIIDPLMHKVVDKAWPSTN